MRSTAVRPAVIATPTRVRAPSASSADLARRLCEAGARAGTGKAGRSSRTEAVSDAVGSADRPATRPERAIIGKAVRPTAAERANAAVALEPAEDVYSFAAPADTQSDKRGLDPA